MPRARYAGGESRPRAPRAGGPSIDPLQVQKLDALALRRRARDRWLANQRVIRHARAIIAASRRRIGRAAVERGEREGVCDGIRARLAAGELPLRTGSAWAGTASGEHACACCGHPIEPGRREYRYAEHPGLHAHRTCFAGWAAECARARAGGPPGT